MKFSVKFNDILRYFDQNCVCDFDKHLSVRDRIIWWNYELMYARIAVEISIKMVPDWVVILGFDGRYEFKLNYFWVQLSTKLSVQTNLLVMIEFVIWVQLHLMISQFEGS